MAAMNSGFDRIYRPDAGNAAPYDRLYHRYLAYAAAVEREEGGNRA